jgi:hypothetical protein
MIDGVTVFVEAGMLGSIPDDESIHAVGLSQPRQALEDAIDFTKALMKSLGSRIAEIDAALSPDELNVELSFTFRATGKATVIPVLLTGETGAEAAIKVSATWRPSR